MTKQLSFRGQSFTYLKKTWTWEVRAIEKKNLLSSTVNKIPQ